MNYVYPIDDKADGHFDIYKHGFWDYPWPQALGWFTSRFLESGAQIMAHKLYVPKLYGPKFMGFYLAQHPKSDPLKVNKLLPFKRTLVLTQNSDMITNLDSLEELDNPDNDADIKG